MGGATQRGGVTEIFQFNSIAVQFYLLFITELDTNQK